MTLLSRPNQDPPPVSPPPHLPVNLGLRLALGLGLRPGLAVLAIMTTACAPIPEPRVLAEAEAVRTSPSVVAARTAAPAAAARGDAYLVEARRILDENDTGAESHAQMLGESALAAYELARATARSVTADKRLATGSKSRDELAKEVTAIEGDLGARTAEVGALTRELAVLEELELPKASGAAGAEREAARRVAGRSLAVDARLFCTAARLLGADPATVTPAIAEVDAIDTALEGGSPTPIDRAARGRAKCLEILTLTRRAAERAPGAKAEPAAALGADALLAELSAAKLEPSRDERGVVVVLRDAFEGEAVSKRAAARLAELDRVAAAHASFPVLVVVHDAKAGGAAEKTKGEARATAAAAALPSAKARVAPVWAGAGAPVADPKTAGNRNARLEIVFVAPRAS